MTALTKDELQIILLDMDINIHKAPPLKPSPSYLALRHKIQKMVDDFCDHSWFAARGALGIAYPKCEKCGVTK